MDVWSNLYVLFVYVEIGMSTYKAIVARVDKVEEIPGANSIQVGYVLGERVVIGKNVDVGTVGVFFMPDIQLSAEFTCINNLYRHPELNSDNTKKGFFDDNCRVRAQTFMKVKSEGFFATTEMFDYIKGYDISVLPLGTQFEELEGNKICSRYKLERKEKGVSNKPKQAKKNFAPMFHEHVETEQFKYYADKIPVGAMLYFHAKGHGSSGRSQHSKVNIELPKWKQLINKVVPVFPTQEWKKIVGTRRVVLKPEDSEKVGFHGPETFREEVHQQIAPYLEKGMSAYYEIVGFANGKSIMPTHNLEKLGDKAYVKKYGKEITYTYNCKQTEFKFYIYRVSMTNEDGVEVDMSDAQCRAWCERRGLEYALEVYPPIRYDGDLDRLCQLVEQLTERPEVLTEDYRDPSHISEGIIIRVEDGGLIPTFYKSKSYCFKVLEGICEAPTIEDQQEEEQIE